ncbi:MAG: hypothetical protein EA360_05675 [Balneolaceae bacterium]|nr:MAG: hypothetical protein EA360_05675 [Balneolaceae bacterium]
MILKNNKMISGQPLRSDQIQIVQMHSFLNLLNVMIMQLTMINDLFDQDKPFSELLEEAFRLTELIRDKSEFGVINQRSIRFEEQLWNTTERVLSWEIPLTEREEVQQAEQIFREIFTILRQRLKELKIQFEYPDRWIEFDLNEFKEDFQRFFRAMQKNSKGRFNIVHNLAEKGEMDYLIHFEVDSDRGNRIIMPVVFKDVIRDLVANARKYTEPGGRIDAGISLKDQTLRFSVQDTGMGIPQEELDKVFTYGYRATNARHMRTMGGGFGLTKALMVTQKLKGELMIQSELSKGTTVAIELPVESVSEVVRREDLLQAGCKKAIAGPALAVGYV